MQLCNSNFDATDARENLKTTALCRRNPTTTGTSAWSVGFLRQALTINVTV